MYCRNYTGTVSPVLYREVYYTVSLFGRVHYQLRRGLSVLSAPFIRSYTVHTHIQYISTVRTHVQYIHTVCTHVQCIWY